MQTLGFAKNPDCRQWIPGRYGRNSQCSASRAFNNMARKDTSNRVKKTSQVHDNDFDSRIPLPTTVLSARWLDAFRRRKHLAWATHRVPQFLAKLIRLCAVYIAYTRPLRPDFELESFQALHRLQWANPPIVRRQSSDPPWISEYHPQLRQRRHLRIHCAKIADT
jgi:hypothetical protein